MKIISFISAFFILLSTALLPAEAAESKAINFYIKKNGHQAPILSEEIKKIETHDAIYMDKECEKRGDKVIYLTFDAGYENGNVEKILDVLKEENVPGAFFLLGHIIRKNTSLVKRMVAEGHIICNHTDNHKDMTTLTKEEMKENLLRLERVYEEHTGEKMEKIFRFPEGRFDEEKLEYAKELGYKIVFWSLAYADWDNEHQPECEDAKRILLENTHNGAIILLHPTSCTNTEILGDLIKEWKSMGYRFGNLVDIC